MEQSGACDMKKKYLGTFFPPNCHRKVKTLIIIICYCCDFFCLNVSIENLLTEKSKKNTKKVSLFNHKTITTKKYNILPLPLGDQR